MEVACSVRIIEQLAVLHHVVVGEVSTLFDRSARLLAQGDGVQQWNVANHCPMECAYLLVEKLVKNNLVSKSVVKLILKKLASSKEKKLTCCKSRPTVSPIWMSST